MKPEILLPCYCMLPFCSLFFCCNIFYVFNHFISRYSRLFDWLVVRINQSISNPAEGLSFIGVLDIYGYVSLLFYVHFSIFIFIILFLSFFFSYVFTDLSSLKTTVSNNLLSIMPTKSYNSNSTRYILFHFDLKDNTFRFNYYIFIY